RRQLALRLAAQRHALLGENRRQPARRGLEQLVNVDRLRYELHRLREVENFGDRLVEALELLERDVEVLAIVVGQLQLAAQDLDVERNAGQRREDVVRDRGRELAERGEPARIDELDHRLLALDDECHARREIARDDIAIAIDRATLDQ